MPVVLLAVKSTPFGGTMIGWQRIVKPSASASAEHLSYAQGGQPGAGGRRRYWHRKSTLSASPRTCSSRPLRSIVASRGVKNINPGISNIALACGAHPACDPARCCRPVCSALPRHSVAGLFMHPVHFKMPAPSAQVATMAGCQ
jgi:hypothetical protein